jgi:S1-C subfamily serine protease
MADTVPNDTNLVSNTAPETVIVTQIVEVENTEKIEKLEVELQKYKDLINNLNELLKNVYEVYGKLDNGSWTGGTGFSIIYNDKYYLITAGHVIENEYGTFKNLGFKVNGKWIYPKLLDYNLGDGTDYAIFYSDKIDKGLTLTDNPDYINLYILDIKTIKQRDYKIIKSGDSGSPVIDITGSAVGILNNQNGAYTFVNSILDNIK